MRSYTKDHARIRAWAEERGAQPAHVKGASQVLRLAFGSLPPNWVAISWEAFFAVFDAEELVFLYEPSPGSRICKLIHATLVEPEA